MSSTAQKQDLSDPEVDRARSPQGRHRAAADRALPAHRRRHPRHEPEGVERLEGASCSRISSTRRARVLARRRRRRARSRDSLHARQARGAAPAAPLRGAGRRRARAVDAPRHALLPAPHRRGDRLARAAPVLARRTHRAGGARRGCRATAPACRCWSTCPTRRSCSRASADSSAAPGCRSSRRRSTRRGTATRSTRSRCTIPREPRRVVSRDDPDGRVRARRSVLAEQRAARAARRRAACRGSCSTSRSRPRCRSFPTTRARTTSSRSSPATGPACSRGSPTCSRNANINVASAKINTLGERAEDVFLIDGARLHDEQALLRLETALYEQLRV